MSEPLPIGEEAAAARKHRMLNYIGEIERTLPEQHIDITIQYLIAQIRLDPNMATWGCLANELRQRMLDTGDTDTWEKPMDWARQGGYIAWKMQTIADADAPICDTHGPMSSRPDPEGPYGTDWFCAGAERCIVSYWWIDGTHLTRSAR